MIQESAWVRPLEAPNMVVVFDKPAFCIDEVSSVKDL